MNRKTVLEKIKLEFAKHGESTHLATRAMIEGRISMKLFKIQAKKGLELFEKQ